MNISHAVAAMLLMATTNVFAAGVDKLFAVTREEGTLQAKFNVCIITGQTVYVYVKGKMPIPEDIDLQKCADDGKRAVKSAYDTVKATFGNAKPPPELIEWRLEWSTAFDSVVPQISDRERDYLQRAASAKNAAAKATTKLTIALE